MRLATPDVLIERARTSTGFSDFGPEGWREGLDRLVAAMDDRDYEPAIRDRIEGRLVSVLETRLRIEDYIAAHPQVLDEVIEGPVFVMGLPRTGTTAVQAFMCNDPQWRYLRGWEANAPIPPPDIATEASDPRMLAERAAQHDDSGLGQNMHISEAGGPVDDLALLRLDFHNQEFGWPAWPYTRWWRTCDMTTTYAYHARMLKLLQSRRPPNRWLVKAPWHNFHVDKIVAQYPDARFVMCHRDPAKQIPSVASIVRAAHRGLLSGDAATSEEIGAFVLEHLTVSIGRVMAYREKHGSDRFIDVRHKDFNADPFGTIEEVYARLGVTLTPETRAEMQAWHGRNQSGAHGEHRYTAEEFGLDSGMIRAAFGDYLTQFDL